MASKSRAGNSMAQPGIALRGVRNRMGWTLADVGKRTGLPVSTLSKIENGKMSLSYDKLVRLSEGLDVDISQLVTADPGTSMASVTGRRSITRAGEGTAIETDNYAHLYLVPDLLNKRFIPIIAEIRARTLADFGDLVRHHGEEYAYVLEGSVELHTDIYAPTRLNAGDSIYFDSGMGHAYLAVGPGRCRVLSICSATQSQLIEASGGQPAATSPDGAKSARKLALKRHKT